MAIRRRKKHRTPEAIQLYLENLIFMLDDPNPHLLPDQESYIDGSDTSNPMYIDVSAGARMKLRLQSMNQLKSLLPLHTAKQHVEELEQKLLTPHCLI